MSMYVLFEYVRPEENPKGVKVDGEDSRSDQGGAPRHSDDQRVSDKEELAKTLKAWPVRWEGHCALQGKGSDCLYQIELLD